MEDTITEKLMDTIMQENGIDALPSPDGVEVVYRGNEDKIRMLINHNAYKTEIFGIELAPFECKIDNI